MKKMKSYKLLIVFSLLLSAAVPGFAQDTEARELLANMSYHVSAGGMPYLVVNTKTKIEKRFVPVPGIAFTVFLDTDSSIISKGITDAAGKATIHFPVALKSAWDASASHTFIMETAAMKDFEQTRSEMSITKAKLLLDTVANADVRTIHVTVLQLNNNEWLPAGNVELKLSVKRMGGELLIGEEETYTTDSTGQATAEFKRLQLPGDPAGNLTLVARVDDHEQFGNLVAESRVPWGVASVLTTGSTERTLWAPRDRAPAWLLFAAGFMVVIVWGVIFFLVVQLIKIRRLGMHS